MARYWDATDVIYRNDVALDLNGTDFSVHGWVKLDGDFFVGSWGGALGRPWLMTGSPTNPLSVGIESSAAVLNSVGTFGSDWTSVGMSYLQATRLRSYLAGIQASLATAVTVTENYQFEMGRAAIAVYSDAYMAEWTIWTVELTADEFTALSRGISPILVHPGNMLAHWPIWGLGNLELDISGNKKDLALDAPEGAPAVVDIHAPVRPWVSLPVASPVA